MAMLTYDLGRSRTQTRNVISVRIFFLKDRLDVVLRNSFLICFGSDF